MNLVEIVFSPTGGTQAVSDIIAENLSKNITRYDLTDYNIASENINISNEEIVIISVPSFGGRVPDLAAERLKLINGNGAKCIIICVYGNRAYEDTLAELFDIAVNNNFNVIAAISAVAEHSIIHKYAAGRPDEYDKEELCKFAKRISDKLNGERIDNLDMSQIPGNRPYKKVGRFGMVPIPNRKCIKCGLCAKLCPVQAIDPKTLVADKNKCISCMRCTAKCPKSARELNPILLKLAALMLKKVCTTRKDNELFI